MSTYYATFENHQQAKDALREMVRGGVRPDDVSLILPGDTVAETADLTSGGSVGDATYFVGRKDDPPRDLPGENPGFGRQTTLSGSDINGIDTSDRRTTGDTVDQMDDSQSEAEDMLYPYGGISQSTHETDDLALSVLTNFPTETHSIERLSSGDFALQDQNEEGIEALDVPGLGAVLGNGALATVALGDSAADARISAFLEDDGVPTAGIDELITALHEGKAVLAVVATPGEINEDSVEEIARRNGGVDRGLFDAPRFYDNEAKLA